MSDREMSDARRIPISEQSRVLVAVHRAMRADGERLIGAVNALPSRDTQRAAALGSAFAAIVSLIHEHHWTDDDVMYPFLLERVASFEADAIWLEDDHLPLDAAMARISARFRLLAHQLTPALWHDTRRHLADEAAASIRFWPSTSIVRRKSSCPRSSRRSRRPTTRHSERRRRGSRPIAT